MRVSTLPTAAFAKPLVARPTPWCGAIGPASERNLSHALLPSRPSISPAHPLLYSAVRLSCSTDLLLLSSYTVISKARVLHTQTPFQLAPFSARREASLEAQMRPLNRSGTLDPYHLPDLAILICLTSIPPVPRVGCQLPTRAQMCVAFFTTETYRAAAQSPSADLVRRQCRGS